MTSDLHALYQALILDHDRRPRNFRRLEHGCRGEGINPVCGDRLTVYVQIAGGAIHDVAFQGVGCAIAKASASLMTESVVGKTVADADAMIDRVERFVTAAADDDADDLGPLSALAGVRRFPVRTKCAMLAWHALRAAVTNGDEIVTTE
jgi:nitrogen fixation protein NifU and related proteins